LAYTRFSQQCQYLHLDLDVIYWKRIGGLLVRITSKCSIAIHCLVFINEYGEHSKVTSGLLALSTGCNPVVIRNIISTLKKGAFL